MTLVVSALWGLAVVVALAAGYAAAAVAGQAAMSWPIFAGWLALLAAMNLALALAIRRRWQSLSLQAQVLAILWLSLAGWYWTVAPFFFYLTININESQLAWTALAFMWEVPVIGAGLFITSSLRLLRPMKRYLDEGRTVAAPERLYRWTLRYPVLVATLLVGYSVAGYAAGTWQLRAFTDFPAVEQVKNLVNGAVISVFLAIFLYLVLDTYLGRVRSALKQQYSIRQVLWRYLNTKVVVITTILTAGSIGLLGLTTFDMLQLVGGDSTNNLLIQAFGDQLLVSRFVMGALLTALLTIGLIVFVARVLTRALRSLTKMVGREGQAEELVPRLRTGDEIEMLSQALTDKIRDLAVERNRFEESSLRSSAILNSMGEGLVVTDSKGAVVSMNRQAERLLGWTFPEIKGKSLQLFTQAVYENGRRVGQESALDIALRSGRNVFKNSYVYMNKDGKQFPVAVTAAVLTLAGETRGAVLLFRDITREKAIDQAKTEFVSLASHQLRTPLTAITWYIELLLRGDPLTTGQRRDLNKIGLRSQRLVRLVNDLLNVSRLDTGRLKIDPVATDLVDLVNGVIDEVMPFAQRRGCEISFHKSDARFEEVRVDRSLLRQVLHNLLINAVKYSPPSARSRVWVQLEKTPGQAYILSVQDNGIGVPYDQRSRIFDKFFRAPNAVSQETEGSGLGLYVARKIMEAGGGKIWFESREGQGTTFFVQIPAQGMNEKVGLDLVREPGNSI